MKLVRQNKEGNLTHIGRVSMETDVTLIYDLISYSRYTCMFTADTCI